MESYNNLSLLYLRNILNSESLKLEKEENMNNHLEIMKQTIVNALKLYSNYKYTKNLLTPRVKDMINYIEQKNEMQKLQTQKKLLTLKNNVRKTGGGKNKKKNKKNKKKKKSLKKKGGGDGLNNVRPYNTVFGSELDVESIINNNKLNKMSRKLNNLTNKELCAKCLDIDFLAGIIDEQNEFVCSDLVGDSNFIKICANRISTASEAHISQCDTECKLTTEEGKLKNYRKYINDSINFNLIIPSIQDDVKKYLTVSLIPEYISDINEKLLDFANNLEVGFNEEKSALAIRATEELDNINVLRNRYLDKMKAVRNRQIKKLREIVQRVVKTKMIPKSQSWKNNKNDIIKSDVTEYTKILDNISNSKRETITYGLMPLVVVGSTFMFPSIAIPRFIKFAFYVLSIVHATTLLISRAEKGGYFKLFLPVIKLIMCALPILTTILGSGIGNPINPFGNLTQGGGGEWLGGIVDIMGKGVEKVASKTIEVGVWGTLATISVFLQVMNDKYIEPILRTIAPMLPIICGIMCMAYIALDRYPEIFNLQKSKTSKATETRKKVKQRFQKHTNWIEEIDEGFKNDGDIQGRTPTELVNRQVETARRTLDNVYQQANLETQRAQVNAQRAQANAQAETARAQLATANATRQMANATSRATELQEQAQSNTLTPEYTELPPEYNLELPSVPSNPIILNTDLPLGTRNRQDDFERRLRTLRGSNSNTGRGNTVRTQRIPVRAGRRQ
jgi:hypothetical protein